MVNTTKSGKQVFANSGKLLACAFIVFAVILGALVILTEKNFSMAYAVELQELSQVRWDFKGYNDYFKNLGQAKGAEYAFAVLERATIAPYVSVHDLAHTIGAVLYSQEGVGGMRLCAHTFDDGCAHAIVIQGFVEQGIQALDSLVGVCSKKTVNSLDYGTCFHGIGHGILAHFKYDYETAIEFCKRADARARELHIDADQEIALSECVSGATMELMVGKHDSDAQKRVVEKYMPETDILMPCSATFISENMRPSCFVHMRSRFFRAVGLKQKEHAVDANKYKKALGLCLLIPETDTASRKACYGGFGTDFAFFANAFDSRFSGMSDDGFTLIHKWCELAGDFEWQSPCVVNALNVLSEAGRSDFELLSRFCSHAIDPRIEERCYSALMINSKQYASDFRDTNACTVLPERYQFLCLESVSK